MAEAGELDAAQGFRVSKGSQSGFQLALENPIGHVATLYTASFFRSEAGRRLLDKMGALGICPVSDSYGAGKAAGPLEGMSVAITGTLSRPRAVFAKMIADAGGKAASAITKNTNYLLTGEGGGSKREKAAKLGVPTLTEAEFLRLLEAEPSPAEESAAEQQTNTEKPEEP